MPSLMSVCLHPYCMYCKHMSYPPEMVPCSLTHQPQSERCRATGGDLSSQDRSGRLIELSSSGDRFGEGHCPGLDLEENRLQLQSDCTTLES